MSPADPHFTPQAPAAAHLPAAVLRQYAAGTLTPAERRRVEHHTLDCALCADALEGYQQAGPQATSPAALTELRQRLHARVEAEAVRAPRVGAWWMAAAAAVLLLAFVGVWQWQRPTQNTAAVGSRPRPAAPALPPAAKPEPAVAAAPAADSVPSVAEAAPIDVAANASTAAPRPADGYAAAPVRSRIRRSVSRRPAAVAARIEAEEVNDAVSGVAVTEGSTPGTAVDVAAAPVLPPPAAAPSKAAAEPSSEAKMATSRMAEVAAAPARTAPASTDTDPASSAPADQPPLREETSKRKSELPPAPALAPFPNGGYPASTAPTAP
jgi:hypothetical protein